MIFRTFAPMWAAVDSREIAQKQSDSFGPPNITKYDAHFTGIHKRRKEIRSSEEKKI